MAINLAAYQRALKGDLVRDSPIVLEPGKEGALRTSEARTRADLQLEAGVALEHWEKGWEADKVGTRAAYIIAS